MSTSVCKYFSVIGNTTLVELESDMPKDSDLVGGASSPYCRESYRQHEFDFVHQDECDCESLPFGAAMYFGLCSMQW